MATFMPPWLDWLDWLKWDSIGAGVVGKILGLWFRACAMLTRTLLRLVVGRRPKSSSRLLDYTSFEFPRERDSARPSLTLKFSRIIVLTLFTFLVWATLAWKALWSSAGPRGERILATILLLVSLLGYVVSMDLFLKA
jgi:hypothetical protein